MRSGGAVVYRTTGGLDAIDVYSRRLVSALCESGTDTCYAPDGLSPVLATSPRPAWILVQYNPFSYGRWGFAPDLVRDASLLRRGTGARLGVMIHEAWVPIDGPKSAVLGSWQRLQLKTLLRLAGVVLTSTEALAREVGRDAIHVPIATNISPVATTPEAARRALGLSDGLVVSTFGRDHEHRALDAAVAAVTAIAAEHPATPVTVLNLGAGAPAIDVPERIDVRTPGLLPDHALSLHLWASDMLLLPFTDGLSTRRSTLMAALAHGRPVVGLRGHNTDSILLEHEHGLALTPVGDVEAFVQAAVSLAADPVRRLIAGAAGRRLYEEHFDWPHVVRRVAAAMDTVVPRPSPTLQMASVV